MGRAKPLSVCSREAIGLILELAREHSEHVRLSFRERENRIEVVLLADTEELAGFFEYMVAQIPACPTPASG